MIANLIGGLGIIIAAIVGIFNLNLWNLLWEVPLILWGVAMIVSSLHQGIK